MTNEPKRCLGMIGLHRKEKVVVSVNRVGRRVVQAAKRTGLNETYSSTRTGLFFINVASIIKRMLNQDDFIKFQRLCYC